MKEVLNVPGHMVELEMGQKNFVAENQKFYSELLYYAKARDYKEGWAAFKYKEKYGYFPNGLQKTTRQPSLATVNFIKSQYIAWTKANKR